MLVHMLNTAQPPGSESLAQARLGLWSNKSSCALDQHVPGYSKYFVDTRSSSHPARTLVTGGQTEAPTGEGALVEPRRWDWNPTCDSETCKFNPLPVNCLLPRWRQPVMRSGSGLSGLERTGCLLSAWPRPFAAPLGSGSQGLRCHHLPSTSTCPFGLLCPAGTVAPCVPWTPDAPSLNLG